MLNKTANSILPHHSRQHTQLRLVDLTTLLHNWEQAIGTFRVLYDSLGQSITLRKQVIADAPIQLVAVEEQHSVRELEKLRLNMLAELRYLLNDMNDPQDFPLTSSNIKRLHRHTLRLQRQVQRIQRMVN